jgi:hypothetical protein
MSKTNRAYCCNAYQNSLYGMRVYLINLNNRPEINTQIHLKWRDGRVVEGTPLLRVQGRNSLESSNLSLSAITFSQNTHLNLFLLFFSFEFFLSIGHPCPPDSLAILANRCAQKEFKRKKEKEQTKFL